MPLKISKSKEAVSSNVGTLTKEGFPQKQAVAIAYNKAGRSKAQAKKKISRVTQYVMNKK